MASSTTTQPDAGDAWRFRPRTFPSSGFQVIDPSERVEEEQLPSYRAEDYYPMNIGDLVLGRYQVVAKLGYGGSSTVWLARAFQDGKYWALKVHVNTLEHNQELQVYQQLADADARDAASPADPDETRADHPGRRHVRALEDVFAIQGPHGQHVVFRMAPLGMSMRTLQEQQTSGVFPALVVTRAVRQVLLGLDFLHRADVVHADLHADNLLIAMTSDSVLTSVEQHSVETPVARKWDPVTQRTTYVSQYALGGVGPLTLCDLGQARIGRAHTGNAMPVPYRAPEIVLGMPWGPPIDTWALALVAWDLLEPKGLFTVYDAESPERNDAHHLAAMTAILGPPPPAFLARSSATETYWNEKGEWHGPVPLPPYTLATPQETLASLVTTLAGNDKENFVDFLYNFLWWEPEKRTEALQPVSSPVADGDEAVAGCDDNHDAPRNVFDAFRDK